VFIVEFDMEDVCNVLLHPLMELFGLSQAASEIDKAIANSRSSSRKDVDLNCPAPVREIHMEFLAVGVSKAKANASSSSDSVISDLMVRGLAIALAWLGNFDANCWQAFDTFFLLLWCAIVSAVWDGGDAHPTQL
jgi:hypothetical protein